MIGKLLVMDGNGWSQDTMWVDNVEGGHGPTKHLLEGVHLTIQLMHPNYILQLLRVGRCLATKVFIGKLLAAE